MQIRKYIEENRVLLFETLKELCAIPAPSHHEETRAAYCKAWLKRAGAEGVYIDEAKNVVCPIGCENSRAITAVVAHTDTVFPDTEPMPYFDDGERIFSPGVGDDTASLSVLLLCAKYFLENKIVPKSGVLFVCNSCEEGLGNLKGTRQIFRDFAGRISRFISFDSHLGNVNDRCVGSHRYEVEVRTEGGHSYQAFGNKNALAELARIISEIYSIKVPRIGSSRTTYNVGTASGGTSVNTIAQNAVMLCEYRSDSREALAIMQENFNRIFEAARARGVDLSVKMIGERPCMGEVDLSAIEALTDAYRQVVLDVMGTETVRKSASTDCNIPLSLGIPALCVGVFSGAGSHTREESIEKESLPVGTEVGLRYLLELFD
ncbi:MAG: M20/M25/M40 family metallo-hydrolase [Clostridia bacterium]|nr:M20/M25/M40 family metallo-hydrolase [Clostridia bacterium]